MAREGRQGRSRVTENHAEQDAVPVDSGQRQHSSRPRSSRRNTRADGCPKPRGLMNDGERVLRDDVSRPRTEKTFAAHRGKSSIERSKSRRDRSAQPRPSRQEIQRRHSEKTRPSRFDYVRVRPRLEHALHALSETLIGASRPRPQNLRRESAVSPNPRKSSLQNADILPRDSSVPRHKDRVPSSRPPLTRSATTTQKDAPTSRAPTKTSIKIDHLTSTASSAAQIKRASVSIPSKKKAVSRSQEPKAEEKVACDTCLEDLRASRVFRLPCQHNMCRPCLKTVFDLSISDPQHMPPRCCPKGKSIPTQYVSNLYDYKWKRKWNQKYAEYTTKNRIYCPMRTCGAWIRPEHMSLDRSGGANTGRKYGTCSKCRTKVCCTCNNKWHVSKECPKDPEAARFNKIAEEEGWRRCSNCQAMVELVYGCNHITCRCRHEFCIVCGEKWKTCNCPQFSEEAIDTIRRAQEAENRMGLPHGIVRLPGIYHQFFFPVDPPLQHQQNPPVAPAAVPAPHPAAAEGFPPPDPALPFDAYMEARRDQERRDAELAERMYGEELNAHSDDSDLDDTGEDFFVRARDLLTARPTAETHAAAGRLLAEADERWGPQPVNRLRQRHYQPPEVPGPENLVPRADIIVEGHNVRPATMAGIVHEGGHIRPATMAGLEQGTGNRIDEWRRWVDPHGGGNYFH